MNFDEIKKVIADAAREAGIEQYDVYYSTGSSTDVETLNDEISNFSSSVSGGLCFRCLVDGKMGLASTELITESEMRKIVAAAADNARATEKLAEGGFYHGGGTYGKKNAPEYKPLSAAELKKLALEIKDKIYAKGDTIAPGTQTGTSTGSSTVRIFNSFGVDLENTTGLSEAYAIPVVKIGDEAEHDWDVQEINDKFDMQKLVDTAYEKTASRIGAGYVTTGKYNIIINPETMRGLLSTFVSAFTGKSAQMGLSLLKGKEGEKIASDVVTITDDPMRPGVSIQATFDAEGVPTYKKNVIENGVLKTLLYNMDTAKKQGIESTGNASKGGYSGAVGTSPFAFCLEAGKYTEDELFALAGDGILITELNGMHAGANPTTGDFSLGSAGFLIENGKKTKAVKEFTVAGNFYTLLKSVVALSDKVDVGISGGATTFGSPYVFVGQMSIAGKQ